MALARWDPFRELFTMRDNMDRVLDAAFSRVPQWTLGTTSIPVDVYQTDDAIVVKVHICGARPEDVDVSVLGDTVTIRAEVKADDVKPEQYLYRELRLGTFNRSIKLPLPVDAENVRAELHHGVLTLTLPKAAEVRARRIHIAGPTEAPAGAS